MDSTETGERLRDFWPLPQVRLPFRSVLVASRDDPHASFARSAWMADAWGSALVDGGRAGHLNAESGLYEWPAGLRPLARLGGHNGDLPVAELGLRTALA